MSDAPVQLIVGVFDDEAGANAAMEALREARKGGLSALQDAALVKRDASGKIHITEIREMTGKKAAGIGAVAGAVFGVMTGPVGWMALGGAALGGVVAKMHDSGFNNDRLKKSAERMQPGKSAVVVVAESGWAGRVADILTKQGGALVSEEINDELAAELLESRDAVLKTLNENTGAIVTHPTTGW